MSRVHDERTVDGVEPTRPRAPGTTHQVLRLQSRVGNAAVAQLLRMPAVQRKAGECPAPAVAPTPAVPAQDPAFRSVMGDVHATTRAAGAHPTAGSQAQAAQAAARPPADDREAQARHDQTGQMAATRPGSFDKASFIRAVSDAIAAQTPRNLEEADRYATSGKADAVKTQVMGSVTRGRETAATPLATATNAGPDTSHAIEKPVTPLPPQPAARPPVVNAGAAAPRPAPEEQTRTGAEACETESTMGTAGVSEQQLATSHEPDFEGALAAKKEGEAHDATAPAHVRGQEHQHLTQASQSMAAAGHEHGDAVAGARGHALTKVSGHQQQTRGADEGKRAEVSGHVRSLFDATKTDVDTILNGLDAKVAAAFDSGERGAKDAFLADVKRRMDAYKDQRYSGPGGWLRWGKDKVMGLPAEAQQLFALSRQVYESRMQGVISSVADLVGAELDRAKARIAQGKAQIDTYVTGLAPELRSVGQEAAQEIGSEFDALESAVDEKGQALAQDLADKYVQARSAVDAEIQQMQEANRGLWDKAKDAIGGAVKTILQLKDLLLGALARAAGAVEKIIKDPIGFLEKFVSAVKTGTMNFLANIGDHLKKGLQGWLFGALANAGIEIPETFDLKGIITLILSVMGLTWANIRARIARQVPEPVLAMIERSVEFVQVLMSEGVSGLWRFIADKVGDLKEMVLGKIEDFVITKVITAGITWIVSLLNPAAAFIKACRMIYDAVMWFVENASRLKDFVDSVLDSVESIASGGVGAVAGYIEGALAKSVPMVISGLADLLGLGGISEKIRSILMTVQKPVMGAVDRLVAGAVATVGRGAGRSGAPHPRGSRLSGSAERQLTMKGHAHTIFMRLTGGLLTVEMASDRRELLTAKIERALMSGRLRHEPAARAKLTELQQLLRSQPGRWSDALATSDRIEQDRVQAQLGSEVNDVAALLQAIGSVLDIDDLKESTYLLGGEIHPEWRGTRFRARFYGAFASSVASHREHELGRLIQEKLRQASRWRNDRLFSSGTSYVCPGYGVQPHLADARSSDLRDRLALDHEVSVVNHWNDKGRRSDQEERVRFLNETTNLKGLCTACNSRKGGDGNFVWAVDSGFKDPHGT